MVTDLQMEMTKCSQIKSLAIENSLIEFSDGSWVEVYKHFNETNIDTTISIIRIKSSFFMIEHLLQSSC